MKKKNLSNNEYKTQKVLKHCIPNIVDGYVLGT